MMPPSHPTASSATTVGLSAVAEWRGQSWAALVLVLLPLALHTLVVCVAVLTRNSGRRRAALHVLDRTVQSRGSVNTKAVPDSARSQGTAIARDGGKETQEQRQE